MGDRPDHLERRLTELANRVEYLVGLVTDLRNTVADIAIRSTGTVDTGVTHHDGTTHAPGTGRLGGTATRQLSDDAQAALAALDSEVPSDR